MVKNMKLGFVYISITVVIVTVYNGYFEYLHQFMLVGSTLKQTFHSRIVSFVYTFAKIHCYLEEHGQHLRLAKYSKYF